MRILLLFLITSFYSFAQNIDFEKVGVKPAKYDVFWGNDISGNNYFSTGSNLYKITSNDTINYANYKFGKISGIETFNMLQTVVFYKQNNAFVLLDAQFNEISSTIFSDINCEILKPASQNELWFYDNFSQKFGLYNLNSKTHRFLSIPINLKIKHCYSDYNNLYFIDQEYNYFSIDKFGKIYTKSVISKFDNISFSNQECVYLAFDELFYVDYSQLLIAPINIREKMIKNFFYKDGILSIFTDSQLITYQIKK